MIGRLRVPTICRASLALLSGLLSLAMLNAVVMARQINDDPSPSIGGKDSIPGTPGKVDVKPIAHDEEISSRLQEILDASERFNDPAVVSRNGVVFLSGEALEPEFKTWAGELASKTQDVAAVVNRMTVQEKSIWDFSEAFEELRDFQASAIQAIPIIVFGVAVLLITWLLARLAAHSTMRLAEKRIPNSLLRWVISKAVMLPLLIFGFYLVLRISGLTQLALTVLGGTGLIGLIIGIAFQDIAENFLASILISTQKPFRIGDLIEIDGHEGVVQRVTTRGTTIMSLDGNLIQIPNSHVYKAIIINYTANPTRRVSFDVGIGYDDSTSAAQQIMMDTIKAHHATLDDPPAKVLIENLSAATVNLRALFWIDGRKNDVNSVRSSVMRVCKQALQQGGISMPDEAREVIFPRGVPVISFGTSDSAGRLTPGTDVASAESDTNPSAANPTSEKKRTAVPSACNQPPEDPISEAEGAMESEEGHLKRQAENSWLPGEGSEVLASETENSEN